MKAHIQHVQLDGVIRVGPECEKHLDPYEQISAFKKLPDNVIEIVGFRAKCPHCGKSSLRPQHVRAMHLAFTELGFTVEWNRANHKLRRVVMPKKDFPRNVSSHSVHKGRDGANEIDHDAADKTIIALAQGRKAAGLVYTKIETTEIADAGKKRKVRTIIECELA